MIFSCISSSDLKISTKVMLSLLGILVCLYPEAGNPIQNRTEDTVHAGGALKHLVQVNPKQE